MVKEIFTEDFDEEVIGCSQPVLVDFWADWCGPCKMLAPILKEVSNEISDKVKVCKINVEDNRQIANTYGIMSIPTLILFKDGEEYKRINGLRSKEYILAEMEEFM